MIQARSLNGDQPVGTRIYLHTVTGRGFLAAQPRVETGRRKEALSGLEPLSSPRQQRARGESQSRSTQERDCPQSPTWHDTIRKPEPPCGMSFSRTSMEAGPSIKLERKYGELERRKCKKSKKNVGFGRAYEARDRLAHDEWSDPQENGYVVHSQCWGRS